MNDPHLEPLSPEIERLLAKERDLSPVPSAVRARAMARAQAAFRAERTAPAASFWGRRATLLVAAALVTAFAAVAIAALRDLRAPSENRASVAPLTSAASGAAAGFAHPPVATAEAATKQEDEVAPRQPEPRRDTPPSRSSSTVAGDSYALELGVLQRARAAAASGEFSAALSAIAEHQRRFPAGRLREEREALRIKALAGLGRNDEARRAAEQFRARFPKSILSSRIDETVRSEP